MQLSSAQIEQFESQGYLLVERLFDTDEVELMMQIAQADYRLAADATARSDAQGGRTMLSLRNELGDDIYSAAVRCPRLVKPMETLLGGEVYHYHHKMMLKEPRVGGAWEWHQDYGYWYDNGCLFPYMASAMIALDAASADNGCLQVIPGSHHMGRVNHGPVGGQTGADPRRVDALLARTERIYINVQPGDVLFFHANLLHRSDQNLSERSRWALIACYNAARNDPFEDSKHPRYSPLEVRADAEVLEVGDRQWARLKAQSR